MLLTIGDVEWGIALTIWVATVTLYISKLVSKITTTYVARKVIHMLGGGVVAV
ncbi:MAG: phosphatidate cytidylyltransferase, partial [Sulfolobaceae archaeon]